MGWEGCEAGGWLVEDEEGEVEVESGRLGWSSETRRTSSRFSEMCVWMGRFSSRASWPRAEKVDGRQLSPKRGVKIGRIREPVGSRERMCEITSRLLEMVSSVLASR